MAKKPFDIIDLLFDILLSVGTFAVALIIGWVTSAMVLYGSEEELGISIYIAIPLWTIFFYAIRRRFKLLVTIIQITISIGITILTGYILFKIIADRSFPGLIWVLLAPHFIVFVLAKHIMDRVVIKNQRAL